MRILTPGKFLYVAVKLKISYIGANEHNLFITGQNIAHTCRTVGNCRTYIYSELNEYESDLIRTLGFLPTKMVSIA